MARASGSLGSIVELFAADPALAHAVLVEAIAAGPETRRLHDDALDRLAAQLDPGRELAAGRELPAQISLMAVGAVAGLLFKEVLAGRAEQLPTRMPDLLYTLLVPFLGPQGAVAERAGWASARNIDPLETGAGAVEADLDRSFRDPEAEGDRRLGQVLGVAHLDDLAVAVAEPVERCVEVGPFDRCQDLLVSSPLVRLDRRDRVGADPGVNAEGLVADDRHQPLLPALGLAQRRLPPPGAKQGFLGDVLRFAGLLA